MKKQNIAKIFSVILPVFAFTVLLPVLEHPTEAKDDQLVLGAFTDKTNQQEIADFNAPEIPSFKRIIFDQSLNSSAKSYLVYDQSNSEVLFEKNSDQQMQTASLTKLMTAIVAKEDPAFSQSIEINSADLLKTSPILGLRPGDKILPSDLLKSMLVGSANDAAWTLANHFPDREAFVSKMNSKAKELGMENTHFSNPMGFDSSDNYSTAADLKKLTQYVLANLPYQEIWKETNFSFQSQNRHSYSIRNSNSLVFDHPEIKSIKTGQTPGASGNMIVQTQDNAGHKIVVIELGSYDRDASTLELVVFTLKNYAWK